MFWIGDMLHEAYGRIDEDITCGAGWYLFETNRRYVFLYEYHEDVH